MSSWSKSKPVTPFPKIIYGVEGDISRDESVWLLEIPKQLGSGLYANLGVFHGRSLILLAQGLKENGLEGKVIGVDTFQGQGLGGYNKRRFTAYYNKLEGSARDAVSERDLDLFVTFEVGFTSDMVINYLGKQFMFVFIDANHEYKHVKEDFQEWSPLIAPNGMLAFHDSNMEGVKRLLSEITGWKMEGQVDSLSYWTRMA